MQENATRIAVGSVAVLGLACVLACGGVADSAVSSSSSDEPIAAPGESIPVDVETEAAAGESIAGSAGKSGEIADLEFEPIAFEADGVSNALLRLADQSIRTDRSAMQLVAGTANQMQVGECIYLTESATVLSVLADAVQVNFNQSDVVAFVTGTNQASVQVGQQFDYGLVEVIETRPYTSLLGVGNTAFIVDAVSKSEWERAVAASRDLEKKGNANALRAERIQLQQKIDGTEPEEWTAGEFKTTATFVSADAENVTLMKADGTEVTVAIAKLDEASQRKATQRRSERSRWNARVKQIDRLLSK